MQRGAQRAPDWDEYQRVLIDLEHRQEVWRDRAVAARLAWDALLRASELNADLSADDPLRRGIDQVAAKLEDITVELESTANIASEEIAAWRRQHGWGEEGTNQY